MASRSNAYASRLWQTLTLIGLAMVLSACNGGALSDGLRPTANVASSNSIGGTPQPPVGVGSETALAADPQQVQQAQSAIASQDGIRTAALPRIPAVAFLPVTGAPQTAVTSLARSMRSAAQNNGVPVVVSLQNGARYQVKGYFSALNDGSGTLVVYVWDVLDANGARVHRISGQERGAKTTGDPWNAIGPEVIDRVAAATMTGLRNWLAQSQAG